MDIAERKRQCQSQFKKRLAVLERDCLKEWGFDPKEFHINMVGLITEKRPEVTRGLRAGISVILNDPQVRIGNQKLATEYVKGRMGEAAPRWKYEIPSWLLDAPKKRFGQRNPGIRTWPKLLALVRAEVTEKTSNVPTMASSDGKAVVAFIGNGSVAVTRDGRTVQVAFKVTNGTPYVNDKGRQYLVGVLGNRYSAMEIIAQFRAVEQDEGERKLVEQMEAAKDAEVAGIIDGFA
jgi:hypothetical protein